MNALISAELLRLRTIREAGYFAIVALVVVASNAAPLNPGPASPAEVTDQLRSLALLGVFMTTAYAAYSVGDGFKRGAVAMTYLTHALRGRVAAAQAITYAGLALVYTLITTGVLVAMVLLVADADHVDAGLSAADVALAAGGAAFGGAVMGAAGALVGMVTRHPTLAISAVAVWNVFESLLTARAHGAGGIGPYLPFQLAGSVMGLSGDVPVLAAMGLLLAYLAAFSLAVRRWALPRDLT
jgi:cytochrome c oxidase subunit IV